MPSDDTVVRISIGEPAEEEWSPALNDRRLELIERDIDGTITREESLELE